MLPYYPCKHRGGVPALAETNGDGAQTFKQSLHNMPVLILMALEAAQYSRDLLLVHVGSRSAWIRLRDLGATAVHRDYRVTLQFE